ncbi:interleukin-8 [Xenopus laevis]|uniref:Chemokine interleukin-8-like domain-containing protein n=3 Tax=Xenopus laevis TaxID=8355 RepID=A0A974DXR9_XENLA|nr:interleukin-8 [Xenopus laevis]OCU00050.1 hypothetical protein XELAEV_18005831mg [Xenopus laevis]
MGSKIIAASVALCLLYAALTQAMTLSGTGLKPNCRCLETFSKFIHPQFRLNEELNNECDNIEVIITVTTGISVCVDPSAPWVQGIIKKNSLQAGNRDK